MAWFYAFLVVLGTFLAVLGITSTNVAIPKMIAPLQTDMYGIEWVAISYIVATAITILAFNTTVARLGLKNTYILGLLLFSLGSALSGQSSSLEEMVLFRFLQGAGEGLLIPSSQSILFNLFPAERRGTAMGFYAMAVAFAPGLGPTVGGYMVEYFSWRWIFYMNIPIVVLLLPVAYLMLPDMGQKVRVPFNLPSFLSISVSSISFIVFLSKGESWGWFYSMKSFYAFTLTVIFFLLFNLFELIGESTLIDYSIFKEPNYLYAVITFLVIFGFVFFQVIYLIPIYLESLRNVPTFQTGLNFLGYAFLLGVFALLGGRLSDKMEPKILLLISQTILFITLFFFLSHLDYYTPKVKIFFYMCLLGSGMGFFFAPLTALAFKSLQQHQIPIGTALYNYARLMGASIATSIATYRLETGKAFHYDEINGIRSALVSDTFTHFMQEASHLNMLRYKVALGQFQSTLSGTYAVQDALKDASYIALLSILLTLVFLFLTRRSPP